MKKPNLILHAVVLIGVSLIGAALSNTLRSEGKLAWFKDWSAAQEEKAEEIKQKTTEDGIKLVEDIQKVKELVESGLYIVIDARAPDKFDAGHIPGAVNLPNTERDEKIADVDYLLSPEQPTLVYCTGIHCDESHLLSTWLKDIGFTNLYLFPGGYEAWEEAKLPIE